MVTFSLLMHGLLCFEPSNWFPPLVVVVLGEHIRQTMECVESRQREQFSWGYSFISKASMPIYPIVPCSVPLPLRFTKCLGLMWALWRWWAQHKSDVSLPSRCSKFSIKVKTQAKVHRVSLRFFWPAILPPSFTEEKSYPRISVVI